MNEMHAHMQATIKEIARPGKGILAADESSGTIAKRLASIQVESTEENRRAYRELLFTTPGLGNHISGVILFEETLTQKTKDGVLFTDVLKKHGVVPGIKVDKGLVPLALHDPEQITQGLDGLPERLGEFKKHGARFAKWRAVYTITDNLPSVASIEANAEVLARYAAICQANGIVPIVEPEVLLDGSHSLARCAEVSEQVLTAVFKALNRHGVALDCIILKPSMVLAGKEGPKADARQVAHETIRVFKKCVPAQVPTVNFLSGGLTPEQSTAYLNDMNSLGKLPWVLSFSYGRALQDPVLKTWKGKAENIAAAQKALAKRATLNGLAAQGNYNEKMEHE